MVNNVKWSHEWFRALRKKTNPRIGSSHEPNFGASIGLLSRFPAGNAAVTERNGITGPDIIGRIEWMY